jgi:hypothetical protein
MVFLNTPSRPKEFFFSLSFSFSFLCLTQGPQARGRFDRVERLARQRHKKRVGHKPGSVVGNHSSGMRVAAQL